MVGPLPFPWGPLCVRPAHLVAVQENFFEIYVQSWPSGNHGSFAHIGRGTLVVATQQPANPSPHILLPI